MPVGGLVVPPALLVAGAALGWALDRAGRRGDRVAAGACWLAAAVLVAVWALQRGVPVELEAAISVGTVPLDLRLDPLAATFGLLVLVPLALLITFRRPGRSTAALAALTAAVALVTIESDRLLMFALGLAVCSVLVTAYLWGEGAVEPFARTLPLHAAWLLLLLAALTLEARAGTSEYDAVPITALTLPVFVPIALAGLLAAGLTPWRAWVRDSWASPSGPLVALVVVPLGFLVLFHAYHVGAGHWPSPWVQMAVAALGAALAMFAAVRGQAATTRRDYLAESVLLTHGLALLSIALGTQLGVAAAVAALAAGALQAALGALLPDRRHLTALLGIAVASGAPTAIVFGGRLLAVQAAVDAGGVFPFLGLVGALAWLVGLAGATRAFWLPPGDRLPEGHHAIGAWTGVSASLAAGVGEAALVMLLASPAAAEVLGSSGPQLGGGLLAISAPSGGWSAALLGGPLLILLGLAVVVLRRGRPAEPVGAPAEPAPEPLFEPPALSRRWADRLAAARIPADYRGLMDPGRLTSAVSGGSPWVWAVVTALAVVVAVRS
jgi:hypothetical protein